MSEADGGRKQPEPATPTIRRPRLSRGAMADAIFDLWLQRQMQAIYGGIALEPLPTELLALMEHDLRRG